MDDIILVRQACPLMERMLVVYVAYKDLALLGQYHAQHVHWAAILGLPLLKVLLVLPVTLDLGHVHGPHHLGVILDVPSPNVVAELLSEAFFVFVLKEQRHTSFLYKLNFCCHLCSNFQNLLILNILLSP